VSLRRWLCYLLPRVIDIAQGTVAKLIDAAAVLLLWRVARGKGSEHERQVAAVFPPLLHIPAHVHLPAEHAGTVNSVVGTWSRENLLDYLASAPGGIRRAAQPGTATWAGAVGTEAAFPTPLPGTTWLTSTPGCPFAFLPAERELFEDDGAYLTRTASWYRREALRAGIDDREREGAFSAARIAELWLDSSRAKALEQLNAFELELRLRRMGMAAGDEFAERWSWSHMLIGVDAVRAFNRLLAPWVAATLMPEPLRIGMLDRCFAHAGLCAVLLAASAAAPNLARAAVECAAAPRTLPGRGVKYAGSAGGNPDVGMAVHRLVKSAHGVPVFSPLPAHPAGLWEMFVAIRVERIARPVIFRQPTPLALRREMDAIHSIVVRVGPAPAGSPTNEVSAVEVFLLSDTTTVGDADRVSVAGTGTLSRAVRALWRSER
jgi:hypothetical protein